MLVLENVHVFDGERDVLQEHQHILIESPRLFFVGKALSATGEHGGFRAQADDSNDHLCGCADRGLSVIINGEHPVRKAARNELRKGAHVIKIMASGGIASPTDPIANLQFSEAEIRAIVEEASFWGSYVMAHVRDARLQSLEYLNEASTRIGFGTDLFGVLQSEQSRELQVRAEVDSNVDVLKSVTSGNAELLNMSGKSGCIKVGEFADLLVLRKNPLTDLSVLQEQGMHIEHIIKAGQIVDRSRHSLATH